ncbi:2Fe-2S iron-sulfur cluster-binding protein [Acetonema longum]|uniref:Succinate dehydrogenase/fumarate reductase Fe-S protein subunit-like protein n=1 Tax=Acetonema longum DSM 6540 TaxID=1009370 RepID=F7NF37_9FIRM|nr:2Fe-2S iron-sulfur cluster-binding protein [Acetonema longum]EGO65292.1 succinate dehydrogenase/fumarate reductase Fe-S protein subunit-like protein [Acetonema longum DSM 6540]
MSQRTQTITARVFRWEPGGEKTGDFQTVHIPSEQPLSVMALLAKIHDQDGTFACRTSTCFKGICGSCMVRVNGQDVMGCTTLIQPGETVVIEPHSQFRVIRDVAVDFAQPVGDR